MKNRAHYPVLVIGTGIAGLTTAFALAAEGIEVLLVVVVWIFAKRKPEGS